MTTTVKKVSVEAKAEAETKEAIVIVEINSLYKNTKAINEAIEKAVFAGSSLQNEYQRIACSVLAHLDIHKDIRIVRHMLDTMPKSLRKDSMSAFFDKFGAVSFDDKGVIHYNKERKCNLKEAVKLAWWKAKKEDVYKPFNLLAKLESVLKQAEKRLAEGVNEEQGDALTTEQVEALRNVVIQLERAEAPTEAIAA